MQMGFFAEAGPVQIFVSNHVSIPISLVHSRIFAAVCFSSSSEYCSHSLLGDLFQTSDALLHRNGLGPLQLVGSHNNLTCYSFST